MKTMPGSVVLALLFPLSALAQAPAPAVPGAPGAAPAAPPAPSGPPYVSPEVHADRKVTFRIQAPKAAEVTFTGDWLPTEKPKLTKGDKGIWQVTLGPLPPGLYIYGFNVDGVATPDLLNPAVKMRARTVGSLVTVPGAEPGFWDAKDVPHGTVAITWHKSAVVGETRPVWIYTPPGYERDKGRKYPVLYLLHGRNATAADWTQAGLANFILDNLLAEKKVVPMIVVMPLGHVIPFDAPVPKNNEVFKNYLVKELVPLVEGKYRTIPRRESRAVFGLSMGGAQALEIGLGHLDLFSQIGTYSAGAPPGELEKLIVPALEKAPLVNKQLKLFWIGCGRQDALFARNEALSKSLTDKQVKHTFRATDGVHNWTIWRQHLFETAPLMFR